MDETIDYVFEQLAGLGELRARRMFGGVGLYCDGIFFALIGNGVLYLKVDESNRQDYVAKDCEAFRPYPEKPQTMSYYELPAEVLERPDAALAWARRSVDVARRARAAKKPRSKHTQETAPAPAGTVSTASSTPIGGLRNLGKVSASWLREVGIETRADLERVGSVGAYSAVVERQGPTSLNLLYALEAALLDVPWTQLPAPLKSRLREGIGK